MLIKFLGTGTSQGVPVIACPCEVCQSTENKDKRLRTSVLVETEKNTILIDAGTDFRQQMLREKVKGLDAILITHNHKDHTGGLDDVRAFNWVNQKPMDIYASTETVNSIKTDYSYAFRTHKYPGAPSINIFSLDDNPFTIFDETITPIKAMHADLPVLGFRIRNFSYLTDANYIEKRELDKMKGTDILVINALRKKKHHSHFTLSEALEIIEYISPKKAFLTHISHQLGFHEEVSKELPKGVFLAYDGLHVNLD